MPFRDKPIYELYLLSLTPLNIQKLKLHMYIVFYIITKKLYANKSILTGWKWFEKYSVNGKIN